MENLTQNDESENFFTLTEDSIIVGEESNEELKEFRSSQISKFTNEESGQNQQNFQKN